VNPSYFRDGCPDCPVENVTWKEAKIYCERSGKRLPTEAEWEYVARCGTVGEYPWNTEEAGMYAWYDKNSGGRTHPAGKKKSGCSGVFDMLGNVAEWCADDYRPYSENDDVVRGMKVVRGGSWYYTRSSMRCANRNYESPAKRSRTIGFRCAK
jgi:formylglycine-generating enzyme required for sulfatase activity